ncbi:MAG TPA: ferredoxin reductase family protein [Patescibacteria group bacterium]|jgi:predicted ferric reductase|nr:ferredoxin reductase family protein [Patescibacteria group bacterium]
MTEKVKRLYLYAVMAVTLLPAFFVVTLPKANTFTEWTLWGSAIAGYVGVVFMLWMYAIGTRAASSMFFIEQARLVAAHKWLGKYGTLLIFLHPVLITLSFGEGWLYSLVPSLVTEYEKHVTYGRIAMYALVIVWLTSAIMRSRLSYRTWKYLHFISYAALPFALLHIPDIGVSYAAEVAARAYFFMIVAGFLVFSLLRARDLLLFSKHRYTVENVTQLTPGVYQLDLMPEDDGIARPSRGQYIYIKQALLSEEHPFSVLIYDERTRMISVTFKVVGMFTESLAQVESGQQLFVSGPVGRFTARIDEDHLNPVVYIAGGIGITPFIERIIKEDATREQWLFYATRGAELAAYEHELGAVLGDRLVSVYSEPTQGHIGSLSAELFEAHLGNVANYTFFLCGPSPMMDMTKRELATVGVGEQQIYTEDFSF